ncbi:hypothetical protein E2C01_050782 [Portunus trituberculatus]|uniref:Uncharacterized protein n=1 Tax=Portunus trituberculatus TaxID=210409 RepID=A0A5B7GGW6_PORTR|nr:hypothetical protein [Portunus trituberculatus]
MPKINISGLQVENVSKAVINVQTRVNLLLCTIKFRLDVAQHLSSSLPPPPPPPPPPPSPPFPSSQFLQPLTSCYSSLLHHQTPTNFINLNIIIPSSTTTTTSSLSSVPSPPYFVFSIPPAPSDHN